MRYTTIWERIEEEGRRDTQTFKIDSQLGEYRYQRCSKERSNSIVITTGSGCIIDPTTIEVYWFQQKLQNTDTKCQSTRNRAWTAITDRSNCSSHEMRKVKRESGWVLNQQMKGVQLQLVVKAGSRSENRWDLLERAGEEAIDL
ncbi:MAG: hypothetical protein EZS28_046369, partial [Streblomastix strix]